jgi:lipoate-protein ligase A
MNIERAVLKEEIKKEVINEVLDIIRDEIEEKFSEEFISIVEEAEKRVEEGKASKYGIEEFKSKFT